MKKSIGLLSTLFLLLFSCVSGPQVNRIDSNITTDISGYWNDTDVKIVCEALINDCLNSPRVNQAITAMHGKTPVVIVGTFKNESMEHINTNIISQTMEITIFNSGKMDFVAGGETREELRAEREDQLFNASEATASSLARETGADFLLTGSVRSIVDKLGNVTVRTYFVTAEMSNIETNARMWMGQNNEIKKVIVQPKNKL
jgi:uncharacterized protein (TIGR02722 family)